MKCTQCYNDIKDFTSRWCDWLCLFNFLEFLHSEETIATTTYENMIDKLMMFKEFAEDQDVELNNSKLTK
jgi:hypothetical protein